MWYEGCRGSSCPTTSNCCHPSSNRRASASQSVARPPPGRPRHQSSAAGVASHRVMEVDLSVPGGSSLTDEAIPVPRARSDEEIARAIPSTYVPARNTIFLSFALAWAEVLEASDIFIGVNALDYSGYPDCRPEYIAAYQNMANLATRAAVEGRQKITIHTPLIELSKAQIIRQGTQLGVDYALTSSCYDPGQDGRPCGHCDSCLLRARGFAEAGLTDPLIEHFADKPR